jgi:hypothetical protein
MGRFISQSNSNTLSGTISSIVRPPGFLGEFGQGKWRVFFEDGTFVVPEGVSRIRVRAVGAGGGGRVSHNDGAAGKGAGGGGGGYAHGEFAVTPLASFAVVVGAGGVGGSVTSLDAMVPPTPGGTSSFGALISATGGGIASTSTGIADGGIGVGGDFRANGGKSVRGSTPNRCAGGGGAGSQLGTGGDSVINVMDGTGSGAGGIAGSNHGRYGGSPFGQGRDCIGRVSYGGQVGVSSGLNAFREIENICNPIGALIRFPFDGFVSGGSGLHSWSNGQRGLSLYNHGGGGDGHQSGDWPAQTGGIGGGGGGGITGGAPGAAGGIGGGGGGGGQLVWSDGSNYRGGNGGPGLVIVEW